MEVEAGTRPPPLISHDAGLLLRTPGGACRPCVETDGDPRHHGRCGTDYDGGFGFGCGSDARGAHLGVRCGCANGVGRRWDGDPWKIHGVY